MNLFFGIFVLLMPLSLFSGRLKGRKKKKKNINAAEQFVKLRACVYIRQSLDVFVVRYAENLNFMNRTQK